MKTIIFYVRKGARQAKQQGLATAPGSDKHPWVGFNHQLEHFVQRPTYPLWVETNP